VMPRPSPSAPLVARRRYLIVVLRPVRRRDTAAAGEEQLGRCSAEQNKHYRLY
jgi:hypothetical protein